MSFASQLYASLVTEITTSDSRLGIQPVLINEMNLNTSPKESMQFIHERTTALVFNSPHIAKCYGLYMSPKASLDTLNQLASW